MDLGLAGAQAVVTERNGYVTGATVNVDGGSDFV